MCGGEVGSRVSEEKADQVRKEDTREKLEEGYSPLLSQRYLPGVGRAYVAAHKVGFVKVLCGCVAVRMGNTFSPHSESTRMSHFALANESRHTETSDITRINLTLKSLQKYTIEAKYSMKEQSTHKHTAAL